MIRPALLLVMLLAVSLQAQEEPRTFRVPFHSVNGMILLDAKVNGSPVTLLLDTGSNVTILDLRGTALADVRGGYVQKEVEFQIGTLHWNRRVFFKPIKTAEHVDGFLGQDILREFSAVRIDYRNKVLGLEQ